MEYQPYLILTGRVTRCSALTDKKNEGLNTCAVDMVLRGTSMHKLYNYAAGIKAEVAEDDGKFITIMLKDKKIGDNTIKIASSLASVHEDADVLKKGDIITVAGPITLSQSEYNGNVTEKLIMWADMVDYQYHLTEEELKAIAEERKAKYDQNNQQSAPAPQPAPQQAPSQPAPQQTVEQMAQQMAQQMMQQMMQQQVPTQPAPQQAPTQVPPAAPAEPVSTAFDEDDLPW